MKQFSKKILNKKIAILAILLTIVIGLITFFAINSNNKVEEVQEPLLAADFQYKKGFASFEDSLTGEFLRGENYKVEGICSFGQNSFTENFVTSTLEVGIYEIQVSWGNLILQYTFSVN